jgi:hypothetical protein
VTRAFYDSVTEESQSAFAEDYAGEHDGYRRLEDGSQESENSANEYGSAVRSLNEEYENIRGLESANDDMGARKSFVAPAPLQPTNYVDNMHSAAQPGWQDGNKYSSRQAPKSSGILSRVIRVARSFQGNVDKYEPQYEPIEQQPQYEAVAKVQVSSGIENPQEESLDIPAFLRRKANQ